VPLPPRSARKIGNEELFGLGDITNTIPCTPNVPCRKRKVVNNGKRLVLGLGVLSEHADAKFLKLSNQCCDSISLVIAPEDDVGSCRVLKRSKSDEADHEASALPDEEQLLRAFGVTAEQAVRDLGLTAEEDAKLREVNNEITILATNELIEQMGKFADHEAAREVAVATQNIGSPDWPLQCKAMNAMRRAAIFHPELLQSNVQLLDIITEICLATENLRSATVRNALFCIQVGFFCLYMYVCSCICS
jgi:hypothetical protein